MSEFLKWWWDKQSEDDQLSIIASIFIVGLIIICIAMFVLFITDWRILCFGSVFIYGAGLTLGGFFTVLVGYDKWVSFKQEQRENEDE